MWHLDIVITMLVLLTSNPYEFMMRQFWISEMQKFKFCRWKCIYILMKYSLQQVYMSPCTWQDFAKIISESLVEGQSFHWDQFFIFILWQYRTLCMLRKWSTTEYVPSSLKQSPKWGFHNHMVFSVHRGVSVCLLWYHQSMFRWLAFKERHFQHIAPGYIH